MKKLIVCMATVLATTGAMAGTKVFNLSLTPDASIYGRSETIEGFTLSVWGENPQTSLALGLVNGTTGNSAGLCLGFLNYADSYKGLQFGLVNYTKQDSAGWGGCFFFSFLNYAGGSMKGLYGGVVNYAGSMTGLHLGLVNYAADADSGVQIGLVNIIHQNKSWFSDLPDSLAPWMIFVNWRF